MNTLTATAADTDKGTRLDRFLSEALPELSRSRAKTLIKEGAVSLNGRTADDPKAGVSPGDTYTLDMPDPVPATPEPEDIPLDILFEDEHLILVNKPAGMAVHPAPGSWQGTLVNALLHHSPGMADIGTVFEAAQHGIPHGMQMPAPAHAEAAQLPSTGQDEIAAPIKSEAERAVLFMYYGPEYE